MKKPSESVTSMVTKFIQGSGKSCWVKGGRTLQSLNKGMGFVQASRFIKSYFKFQGKRGNVNFRKKSLLKHYFVFKQFCVKISFLILQ